MADSVNRSEAVRELAEYAKQFPHYQALLTEYNIFSLLRAPYKALSQGQREVLEDLESHSDVFGNSFYSAHHPYTFSIAAVDRLDDLIARAYRMDPRAVSRSLRSELESLDLRSDHLVNDGDLEAIGLCRNLTSVDLRNTSIGNLALQFLSSLPRLRYLNVNDTKVNDEGLAHWVRDFRTLEHLSLGGPSITNKGVSHLALLASIRTLRIDCPRVSPGAIARLLRQLPHCKITGPGSLLPEGKDSELAVTWRKLT